MVDREQQPADGAPRGDAPGAGRGGGVPGGRAGAGEPRPALRIALAHDWLVGMRGGERVLEAIARTLASEHHITALYTMFDDGRPLSPDLDAIPRRVAWLGRIPGANRLRRWLLPLYPLAVGSLSSRLARDHAAEPIDLLISTSSAAIKGLRPPRGVPHLCYCHTPARYLWSQAEQYARGLAGLGLLLFGALLRRWDRRTSGHVSAFLANSSHTQREIARCYGREAVVLFPPVRTGFFMPRSERETARDGPAPGYWLAAGAIEPYKRFEDAIEASRRAGAPLVIAGTGSGERRLRARAGPHVTFAGRVDDAGLRDLYRGARLLIFPQVEDFGIVAAEAQACGCPVLALGAGGALDTVVDGVTGALFEGEPWIWFDADAKPPWEAAAEAAVRVPERSAATTAACRANAERFSEGAFAAGLRRAVAALTYDRPHARRDPA